MCPLRRLEPVASPSIADGDLVRRAVAGDAWAEDALYRRHARPIAGLVARLLGSKQDAEDVVHDAFVHAFQKLDRLREPDAFRGWLSRIAITQVRRVIRRRRLARSLGLLPLGDDAALEQLASSAVSPEVRAELAVVDGILRRLPTNDRIAWMLRVVEGHRLEEVAELSGCSLATAKRRIAAAQKRMNAVLDVQLDDGRLEDGS